MEDQINLTFRINFTVQKCVIKEFPLALIQLIRRSVGACVEILIRPHQIQKIVLGLSLLIGGELSDQDLLEFQHPVVPRGA